MQILFYNWQLFLKSIVDICYSHAARYIHIYIQNTEWDAADVVSIKTKITNSTSSHWQLTEHQFAWHHIPHNRKFNNSNKTARYVKCNPLPNYCLHYYNHIPTINCDFKAAAAAEKVGWLVFNDIAAQTEYITTVKLVELNCT